MVKQLGMSTTFGALRTGRYFAYENEYYRKTGLHSAFNIRKKSSRAMHKDFIIKIFEEIPDHGLAA